MNEETFNLYGIKITCFGDVERAKLLAPHTRRLMPQIKGLGLPMHTITSPDGSYVQVLHQAGMDFARIYVPPMKAFKKPKPKITEEFIQLYYPAWFAYNDSNEHIGYIIALGGGWQGPYEFIPREAKEMRDDWASPLDGKIPSFEMGQWTEWWGLELWNGDDSIPFEWDDYLTPKLLYITMYQPSNDTEVEKMYFDIAPVGAHNRIFNVALNTLTEEKSGTDNGASEVEWCDGERALVGYTSSSNTNYSGHRDFVFTISSEDSIAASRDDILDSWPDGAYKPLDVTFNWGMSGYSIDWEGSKVRGSGSAGSTGGDLGCSEWISLAWDAFPEGFEPPTDDGSNATWADYSIDRPSRRHGSYDSSKIEVNYGSSYSSAEDENHYGCLWIETRTVMSQDINQSLSDKKLLEYSYGDASPANWDPEDDDLRTPSEMKTTVTADNTTYINMSGKSFEVPTAKQFTDCDPRYYRVGELEILLACITHYASSTGYERRYVFVQKNGDALQIEYDLVVSSTSFHCKFPALKGPEDQTLYISNSFRLIRVDTKTTKEQ